MARELYTGILMLPRRIIRIVAIVLAIIAGTVFILGYNFFTDKNIRPEQSRGTLDW